ncbi:membrane hypothetical protein [Bradyrhizobium sp. STM 3843]|uniref:hypothetical protein n=1 Tax=Bradyrhizobium sp. STM 3843 TaxID=551947 RepID=UPI00024032B0|nr:hypothetical protein [Bradyrhizobium sp. STM 3843]CCE11311.1 membrane hypothetical protein [Bradyrhizobium sp. STM 3843]
MALNKGGLVASGLYTVHYLVFSTLSHFASLKSSIVLAGLAVLPSGLFLGFVWSGLGLHDPPFPADSWMNSDLLYYPVSLLVSYLLGWGLNLFWHALIRLVGYRLEHLDERLIRYLDRDV